MDFASWKDRKSVAQALRTIYRATDAAAGQAALEAFAQGSWGSKYPAIAQSWRRNWELVIPFFAFPEGVRRIIYTTDEIDKRFGVRRGSFPCAGDLVAKRGVSAGSAAGQPASCLAGLRHPRTFSSILPRAHFPTVDETGVVALGLFGDLHLLVA